MANKEILILGAGPAGLAAALESKKLGNKPHILTPTGEPGYRSVYTIFGEASNGINKDLFPGTYKPLDDFYLITNEASVRVRTGSGFVVIDYPQVIRCLEQRLQEEERTEFFDSQTPMTINDRADHVEVGIGGEKKEYDALIDCSGGAAATRTGENPIVEYVYGGLFRASLRKPEMIIAFVREIGGTCWINPSISGEGYVDVVVSGWGRKNDTSRFMREGPERLRVLKKFLEEKRIVNFANKTPQVVFSGTIRSQLARSQGHKRIYAAGDAAGMARPKTGDGFRWAIYGGEMMARAIENGISPDRALAQFYVGERAIWKELFLQGATFYRLSKQQSGNFGTSVGPLGELIKKHHELQESAINFFLNGGIDSKLLFALLEDSHFRGIMVGSFLAQLRFFIQGEKSLCPGYPFPETVL